MNKLELAQTLEARASHLAKLHVVTGFDGFVDEMITVVKERHDLNVFERVETIDQFGDLIKAAAGHSSLREIMVTQTDPGGCAVNMGDGLATLGLPVVTFATVGEPMHGAFNDYAAKATVYSWGCEPGRTLAFEFVDGKLMHSAVTQLAQFTPEDVTRRLADGSFQSACAEAKLIALTNWSLYPHMTACWQLLQKEVFAKIPGGTPMFLDLVDPSSRSEADIIAMMATLSGLETCGPTTLGLNQNEANILSRLSGGQVLEKPDRDAATRQADKLREALGISEVVTHGQKYAVLANSSVIAQVDGPYCSNPKKSTGAGDRFNAGYSLGLMLNLEAEARLLLATSTSGLYVRKGASASLPELIAFLKEWSNE